MAIGPVLGCVTGLQIIRTLGTGGAGMATEAQKRAKARYAEKVVQKQVRFYPPDQDLVDWCECCGEPFATYVKRLIREDMESRRGSDG